MKKYLWQPRTKGRYQTAAQAKTAARKNAPSIDWNHSIEVIRYDDTSFDWIVNTSPLTLPNDAIGIAYFSRRNKKWTTYTSAPNILNEI